MLVTLKYIRLYKILIVDGGGEDGADSQDNHLQGLDHEGD